MLFAKKSNGTVLLIGNSRTYRNFDAKFIESKYKSKKIVNLSDVGNPTIKSEVNLKNYFHTIEKPEIVIMEFSNLFNDAEAILKLRPFQGKNKLTNELIRLYYPKYYLIGNIVHLFRYNTAHTIYLLYRVFNTVNLSFQVRLGSKTLNI